MASKPAKINDANYRLLIGNIIDFKETALMVEQSIPKLHTTDETHNITMKMDERDWVDEWMSKKTVSHFNLGIALELTLKFLLLSNDKDYRRGHGLTALYDLLPEPVQRQLESTYQASIRDLPGGLKPVAVIKFPPLKQPRLRNRPILTLRAFFEYFDQVVKLSEKRFAWEQAQLQRSHHYLSNLTLFIELIEHVLGNIPRYVVREDGGGHEGTRMGETGKRGGANEGTEQRKSNVSRGIKLIMKR